MYFKNYIKYKKILKKLRKKPLKKLYTTKKILKKLYKNHTKK